MLNIWYDPVNGKAISDAESISDKFISEIADYANANVMHDISISTETTINSIIASMAEGVVNWQRVTFMIEKGVPVSHNEYGVFKDRPEGFLDSAGNIAYRTLKASSEKQRKRQRQK